jgi:lambda family phage portal protein
MQDDLAELLGSTAEVLPASTVAIPAPATVAAVAGGGVQHDGAKTFSELALWRPQKLSADAEMLPEKDMLDARAADMLRNDAFVSGGARIWKDSIVGAKFMLNSQPMTKVLWGKDDDVWEEEFQEEVESKFDLWADAQYHWPDSEGKKTLTELVRLAVGVYVAGGEVVGIADWMPRGERRPFRTAFQMIDADRLSDPLDQGAYRNPRMRKGVEVDERGRPVAYYFRNTHPSEGAFQDWTLIQENQWTRVPANRPWGRQNVLHIFEQNRPFQSRGISTVSSALTEMRMFKHLNKTQLQKAVIAATYATSIEAELPQDITAALGAGYAQDGNATTQWMLDYLNSVQEYSGGAKNLHMAGASIPVLPPGAELKIQNPGTVGPDYEPYVASILRYIASSFDLSYEQFSRDYTNTNYSSARASIGEMWKSMQVRKKMVAERIASFIYTLWLEEAINSNQIEALKRKNVPLYYEGLNSVAYSHCEWIGAGRGMIDPLKETQADVLALKNGLDTKENVIARRSGQDWRRVGKQISRELKRDEALKIPSVYTLGATDAENALSGTPQERES